MEQIDYFSLETGTLPPRTLCFLLDTQNQVLLGMKKRGFGVGKWNGFGGKLEPGETVEAATIRETQEECLITPLQLEKVAIINFYFPYDGKEISGVAVHTYICRNFTGEAQETEEMKPQWFERDSIPYPEMWPDDAIWLPLILEGRKLEATFVFADSQNIAEYRIQEKQIIA